jgi:hypothetical protein
MTENLPAQQSTFESQIVAITAKLRPAEEHVIGRVIKGLLEFGFAIPPGIPAAKFSARYAFGLAGLSEFSLQAVAGKLVRGEYEEHTSNFLPIPAEFAKLARREEKPLKDDRMRLRVALENASIEVREQRSPEMQARISEQVARAVKIAKFIRGKDPEPPIDGERAEYIKRIMAIRDRNGITAEEQTRRRKSAADIERYEREHGGEDA